MAQDRAIQAKDLVIVVNQRCCGKDLGMIFRVRKVRPCVTDFFVCDECGANIGRPILAENDGSSRANGLILAPLEWLKRIDPDSLKSDAPTEERLTA